MSTFKREADMLLPIIASRHEFSSHRTLWEHFYEIQTLKGVVDVIFAVFKKQALEDRRSWGVHSLQSKSEVDIVTLLSELKKQQASERRNSPSASTLELAEGTLHSPSHLSQQLLPRLIEYGWVERTENRRWQAKNIYSCPVTSMYAIEVKRSDWQRALSQATSHKRFANKTFLALDAERLPRSQEALHLALQHAGVGLLSLSADTLNKPLRVLANPPRKSPHNTERSVVAERVLAVRSSDGNSGFWGHVFGKVITTSSGNDPRKSALQFT